MGNILIGVPLGILVIAIAVVYTTYRIVRAIICNIKGTGKKIRCKVARHKRA